MFKVVCIFSIFLISCSNNTTRKDNTSSPTAESTKNNLKNNVNSASDPIKTNEQIITEIRQLYKETLDNKHSYHHQDLDDFENSSEGGQLTIFKSDKKIRLIETVYFGHLGKVKHEFYFLDDKLYFMYSQEHAYNAPPTQPEFDDTKTSVEESRFYFWDNKMIRWIKPDGQHVDSKSAEFDKELKRTMEIATKTLETSYKNSLSNPTIKEEIDHFICFKNNDGNTPNITIGYSKKEIALNVRYEGQKDAMRLQFVKKEFKEGHPSYTTTYNELVYSESRGPEINGRYEIIHSGVWDYVKYTRGRDSKVFNFTIIHDKSYQKTPCF
ncbi:hypothetical protein [Aquimarina aggregata]|nr:hypothetical protein [Aquimarina aggregata]